MLDALPCELDALDTVIAAELAASSVKFTGGQNNGSFQRPPSPVIVSKFMETEDEFDSEGCIEGALQPIFKSHT